VTDAQGSRPGRKFVTTEAILAKYPASTRELITGLRSAIGDSYGSLKAFYAAYVDSDQVSGRRIPYAEVSRQLSDGSRFRNGPDDQLFEAVVTLCLPDPNARAHVRTLRRSVAEPVVQPATPAPEKIEPGTHLPSEPPEAAPSDDESSEARDVDDEPEAHTWGHGRSRSHDNRPIKFAVVGSVVLAAVVLPPLIDGPPKIATKPMGVACEIPSGPLAAVVSGRSNSPAPAVTDEFYQLALASQRDKLTKMAIVNLDGRPTIERLELPVSTNSGTAHTRSAKRAQEFTQRVRVVRAKTEQADVLAALDLAAREVQGSGEGGTVFVLDSGLATSGPLDFTRLSLNNWPIDIVNELQRGKLLPNLRGVTVVLAGIGDTAPPQQQLTASLRQQLLDIWGGIARAAGAACTTVLSLPRTEAAPDGAPPVKPVPVSIAPPLDPQPGSPKILSDEGATFFKPDSAQLADEAAARAQLAHIASWLSQSRARHAHIVGTTANRGPKSGQVALSLNRANTISMLLVKSGVEPGQITTEGAGSDFPEYIRDIGPNGEPLPNEAQKNRTIRISLR